MPSPKPKKPATENNRLQADLAEMFLERVPLDKLLDILAKNLTGDSVQARNKALEKALTIVAHAPTGIAPVEGMDEADIAEEMRAYCGRILVSMPTEEFIPLIRSVMVRRKARAATAKRIEAAQANKSEEFVLPAV